jgi:hypothetical protein
MATKMVMAMARRVAGNKESKGRNAMATATRVASKQTATVTKRVMARATREEVGKEEGDGKGG